MKNLIFVVITLLFIACNKEQKIIPTDGDYDFSKDSCGHNLLKGIYVSTHNNIDTLTIDSNITAYTNGSKPSLNYYQDIFSYCADKDSIILDRWGWTKPNLPKVKIAYSLDNNILSFSKVDLNMLNCTCDTFFASINYKSYRKVK
jgi:hypothetical protein